MVEPEPNPTLLGTWRASTIMGDGREGGSCTATFDASSVTMHCSPGNVKRTAMYRIVWQDGPRYIIAVDATSDVGASVQRVAARRIDGQRALVIDAIENGNLLGAYGRPEAWLADDEPRPSPARP